MSKRKNIKRKNVNADDKIIKSDFYAELYKILKIVFGVVAFLALFYLITVIAVGNDEKTEKIETSIQYEEILAGSSFTMRDDEYLVVYYDFSDSEMSDVYSAIYTYNYSGKKRLYTVDMSNGFNSKYTNEKSNKKPENAEELAINGPTLILIKEGKVKEYIEGKDFVVNYLS